KSTPNICVCGDFNIALEDKDIHEKAKPATHIMSSDAEREALRENVLKLGFADAFRKFTSEGEHYSWWDYRAASFNRNRGWRIDHHYLTPDLYQRATSCTIDIEPRKLTQPSDHTPVTVELSVNS
ncbi:MAG: exodeoxyribonuclease III, partial [Cyanobacteria bacterium J06621_15]